MSTPNHHSAASDILSITEFDANQIERRAALAAKVATLEERSIQSQKQMDRIESMLITHANEEEGMLRDINVSLVTFEKDLSKKISDSVKPINEDITRYKTIMGVFITIVTAAFSIVGLFKDAIVKWFST